ncbi:GDSL-type esterase/lipase family protein [Bacteroides ovatus]|uniref:Lysophospholipase L1 n=1 Tax=Bacteroides ovatus TaxID=28116 RepID=A0A1G8CP71_BACOV|nr:GDSL-type esterase/lipase family protein [Bacteroides ovatus]SDH47357.1 Lysophospholipase L1 [Bacteroides ovatus]
MLNRIFFKLVFLGICISFLGISITSCKNYDDDIQSLENQVGTIDSETGNLRKQLENVINGKLTVANYEPTAEGGWKLYLSNGKAVNIPATKNGSSLLLFRTEGGYWETKEASAEEWKQVKDVLDNPVADSQTGLKAIKGKVYIGNTETALTYEKEKVLLAENKTDKTLYIMIGSESYLIPMNGSSYTGIGSITLLSAKDWLEATVIEDAEGNAVAFAPAKAQFKILPEGIDLSEAVYTCGDMHVITRNAVPSMNAEKESFDGRILTMRFSPSAVNDQAYYAATLDIALGKSKKSSRYFVVRPTVKKIADAVLLVKETEKPATNAQIPCTSEMDLNDYFASHFTIGFAEEETGTYQSIEELGFETESVKTEFSLEQASNRGYLLEDGKTLKANGDDAVNCKVNVKYSIGKATLNYTIGFRSMEYVAKSITLGKNEQVRIACVGNSITAGSGILDAGENGYPAQLNKLLGTKYQVLNCGASGTTMTKLRPWMYLLQNERFDYSQNSPYFQRALDLNPHIVIIKLGTNDSKKDGLGDHWEIHKEEYATELEKMVLKFKENGSSKGGIQPIFYLCYPCMTTDNNGFGIKNTTIETKIIPEINAIAKKNHWNVIDLHYDLLDPMNDEDFTRETDSKQNDNVHPNSKGAAKLAAKIKEELERTLTVEWE